MPITTGSPEVTIQRKLALRVCTCPYQTQGRLLTGEDAVICTLVLGVCPLQAERPTTAGRHATVCLMPDAVLSDWQQVVEVTPD